MPRSTVTEQATIEAPASERPVRVLVADPDADARALYEIALQSAGCEVTETFDGRDALTKALIEPPTLVIAELRLPLVDGYALCDILRRDEATRTVPILIVTAETRSTELDRVWKIGADAVLVKPVPPDAILREMRDLLTRPASRRPRPAPVDEAAASHSTAEALTPPREHRTALAKSHLRGRTTMPPASPPALTCPSCDSALTYEYSYVGGVSKRHPEQWDYYLCTTCGTFQYRQRTRRVRRIFEDLGHRETDSANSSNGK
jgi:DNA-binding response OmpR family regulator